MTADELYARIVPLLKTVRDPVKKSLFLVNARRAVQQNQTAPLERILSILLGNPQEGYGMNRESVMVEDTSYPVEPFQPKDTVEAYQQRKSKRLTELRGEGLETEYKQDIRTMGNILPAELDTSGMFQERVYNYFSNFNSPLNQKALPMRKPHKLYENFRQVPFYNVAPTVPI